MLPSAQLVQTAMTKCYFNMGQIRPFLFIFVLFTSQCRVKVLLQVEKSLLVCLGFEPVAAGWRVQTNPLSLGIPCSSTS